jgi:hypothetical protein
LENKVFFERVREITGVSTGITNALDGANEGKMKELKKIIEGRG